MNRFRWGQGYEDWGWKPYTKNNKVTSYIMLHLKKLWAWLQQDNEEGLQQQGDFKNAHVSKFGRPRK